MALAAPRRIDEHLARGARFPLLEQSGREVGGRLEGMKLLLGSLSSKLSCAVASASSTSPFRSAAAERSARR